MITYFAKLDENNQVLEVIVADQAFVDTLSGVYIQTDINGVSPKNYAGIGYTYRADLNGFIAPQLYPSWTLDETSCSWKPPVAPPGDGHPYYWDEDTKSWAQP